MLSQLPQERIAAGTRQAKKSEENGLDADEGAQIIPALLCATSQGHSALRGPFSRLLKATVNHYQHGGGKASS